MGMFDSFYIEYQEKEHEVQTKQFENLLDIWRIGDVVNQPKAGVQVYFEERFWNTGTDVMDYSFEHDDTANCVIFIMKDLINRGFKVNYTHPNLLLINWMEKPKTVEVRQSNNFRLINDTSDNSLIYHPTDINSLEFKTDNLFGL